MITWMPASAEILDVARRMRESDRTELIATSWATDQEQLAQETARAFTVRGAIAAARNREDPIVIGALVESRPNVISLGMFATEAWPTIAHQFGRFVRSKLIPELIGRGAHRFEALSMTSHVKAHRFLTFLGLDPIATLRAYGRNREDFTLFSRVIEPPKSRPG